MTRPEDLDDHALLRFLEERAFGLVGTERVLLEQLQNNRRRAVRAPSGPTEG